MFRVVKYLLAIALFAGMFSFAYASGGNHNTYTNFNTDVNHYTTWTQDQQNGTNSNSVAQACGWAATTCTMGVNLYCPASITCTDIPPVNICMTCQCGQQGEVRLVLQNPNSQPDPTKAFNFSIGGQENTAMTFFFTVEGAAMTTTYGTEMAIRDADDQYVYLIFDPNSSTQPAWWWTRHLTSQTYTMFNPSNYNMSNNGGAYWSFNTVTQTQINALSVEDDATQDPTYDHECIQSGMNGALSILYAPTAIVVTPGAQAGPHFFDVSFGVRFDYGY